MLIQAPVILTLQDGAAPFSGAVRVEGSRIREIGTGLQPRAGEEVVSLDHHILLPGLINAHCHLDYTSLKNAIFPGKSFTSWIRQINALKQSLEPEDYVRSIETGYNLLLNSGCTTVFNIEAFPELLLKLTRPPLRVWWFLELIDVRTRLNSDEMLMGALEFFESHPEWLGGFGLAPHAPYTSSIELFRLAKHCSEEMKMPFTTHIAESIDEQEMFLHGKGELHEFLSGIGRNMDDCGHGSSLSHLMEFGLLNERCIAVHLNYLHTYDFDHLREHPLNVVHCPLCHQFFDHRRFPLHEIEATGSRVMLGTDSLASNHTLDLRAEIRQAAKSYPDLTPRQWLEKVTRLPARAIGMEDELGVFKPGALADLIAIRQDDLHTDPCTTIIESTTPPDWICINGKMIEK